MLTYNEYSAYLPIKILSSITGANSVTIRAWERRYGLLKLIRTEKGHRLYNQGHVQRIKMILNFIEKGIPISQINSLLDELSPTKINTDNQNIWLCLTGKIHLCFFVTKQISELEKFVSNKNIVAIIYIGSDNFLRVLER